MNVETIAREAVSYALMEAGALGTETRDSSHGSSITAYFEREPQAERLRLELEKASRIYQLSLPDVREITIGELADQDWLTEWKKHWQPVEIGRFIVAPPWSESPAGLLSDRDTIVINPGMAFGTGTHETTRLCLKAIEKYYAGGSFLDVGTGTGILAIAAAKLGQKPNREAERSIITACDIDAEAVAIAKENADLNQVAEQIEFRVGSVDAGTSSADFVCANLTAPVIVEILPALLGVACGRLILSGILDAQFEMVHARLVEQGATVNEIMQDGEWIALVI